MKVRPGIIVSKDDKILLMKYNYNGTEVFNLPGGNPEKGETLESALVRELKEELNIDVEINNLALVGEVILEKESGQTESTLHCIFSGKISLGCPRLNPAETSAPGLEWKEITELDLLNMYPNVGRFIKKPPAKIYIGQIEQQWF